MWAVLAKLGKIKQLFSKHDSKNESESKTKNCEFPKKEGGGNLHS